MTTAGDPVSRADWTSVQLPQRRLHRRGEDTRRRLILAAADLFAEHGIDAVATQDILERAGQHNESAIQYHFGSRAGLIIAVLQPREDVRSPIEADRSVRLDRLEGRPDPATLHEAVETLVLPSMGYLATHEGRSLIRVAAQVMRTLPLALRVDPSVPPDRRATVLVESLIPASVPMPERQERLGVARTLIVELVANRAREVEHGLDPHLDEVSFAREAVAMTVGLLAAG